MTIFALIMFLSSGAFMTAQVNAFLCRRRILRSEVVLAMPARRQAEAAETNVLDLPPLDVRRIAAERPWTDLEREAFGVDETERWIADTDKILAGLEQRSQPAPADAAPFDPRLAARDREIIRKLYAKEGA